MKRLLISLVVLSFLLAGCSSTEAKDQAGTVIATYANPLADTLISGILTRDYATFSQDFDEAMLTGIPESGFQDILSLFDSKVAPCTTHELYQAGVKSDFPYAIYKLNCDKSKNGVFIRIVITPDEPHKVTGLWFDAAELR